MVGRILHVHRPDPDQLFAVGTQRVHRSGEAHGGDTTPSGVFVPAGIDRRQRRCGRWMLRPADPERGAGQHRPPARRERLALTDEPSGQVVTIHTAESTETRVRQLGTSTPAEPCAAGTG